MRLTALGCSGGELGSHRTTSFLLGERVAIDAGALTRSLPLEALSRIEHVVLTHAHLDHVRDLPLLADLLMGSGHRLEVHASTGCAETLRRHLFNGELWPDFTRLPSPRRPALKLVPFEAGAAFSAGGFRFRSVAVHHPVESVGLVVSDGELSFALSGDTGPTEALWAAVNAAKGLRALLLETSFPSTMQRLADVSGHLTPATMARELAKLDRPCDVFLYHLKPAHRREILREVAALHLPRVKVLREGWRLDLGASPPGRRSRRAP